MLLKYAVPNTSTMTLRSFWLLASKCHLVTPKWSLAELDRLFFLNRVRQLYPHPRTHAIRVSPSLSPPSTSLA